MNEKEKVIFKSKHYMFSYYNRLYSNILFCYLCQTVLIINFLFRFFLEFEKDIIIVLSMTYKNISLNQHELDKLLKT